MLRIVVLSVLIAFVHASPTSRDGLDGKIIGGEEVDIEEVPYTVVVMQYGSHFCGGSIITSKHILTAAHCVHGYPYDKYSIRYGSSSKSKGGKIIKVVKIVEHPDYDTSTQSYDMAILELAADIELFNKAQIVELAENEPEEGDDLLVLGWGKNAEGYQPDELFEVKLPTVSRKHCRQIYGERSITEQMICAGYKEGGKDSCGGDSGGPAISLKTNKLVGIVSWGIFGGCARPNFPAMYTNVAILRSFIKDIANV